MRFRLHKTPHFVELGAQSTTHLKLIRAPDFHLDLLGIYDRQHRMMHRLQLWLFFFSSLTDNSIVYKGFDFCGLREHPR